jgi:hypothetical protein
MSVSDMISSRFEGDPGIFSVDLICRIPCKTLPQYHSLIKDELAENRG